MTLRTNHPTRLVVVGDDDDVRLEHAVAMYRIRGTALMVVPGTSHGMFVDKPDLCTQVIVKLLTADQVGHPGADPSRHLPVDVGFTHRTHHAHGSLTLSRIAAWVPTRAGARS